MNEKLVSIITPCYNGEKFIHRYLDSILDQTYSRIELIFINDGSTDKTEEILLSYKTKFQKKGIELIYIYQKNSGQASAINKGLKIFKGDYITWPDSDDILTKNSIESKVKFLEENKNYGIVRTDAAIVNEESLDVVEGYFAKSNKNKYKENLFLDFIIEDNVWFAPGCYMIRKEALLDVNPSRKIYESRGGQNWQMILPVVYKYKCGFIDEPLYIYVVRKNSHSHKYTDYQNKLKIYDEHEDILINTLSNIRMKKTEIDECLNIVKEKYIRRRMFIAEELKERSLFKEQYILLKQINKLGFKDRIKYVCIKNRILYRILKKVKRCLTNND